MPQTPCNRCVRFAATIASGNATLAIKRTLLLTWAGLAPAGSHQLTAGAPVGKGEQRRRHREAERPGGPEIDGQLQPTRVALALFALTERAGRELGKGG
jgi:hypothetical protein